MMALDRRLKADLDAEQANRAKAPETCRVESLLWALAEKQTSHDRHASVGLIAGTVGDWARLGRNLEATEILIVLEAAFRAAGIDR
jgi:hypothetical protein